MIGLEFISAGLLHLMTLDMTPVANPVASQVTCPTPKQLLIDVVSAQNDVRYDFSKKTAELNQIGKGAYSPYGEDHLHAEVRGLTAGKQSLNHNIEFYFEKYKEEGLACLQIQKVTVTMNYNPTVYISTKFEKGTPIFNKILEHEMEHVKITQRMLDQYKPILKEQLKNDLSNNFSAEPFPIDHFQKEQRELENTVRLIITQVERTMDEEAQRQHNQFDDAELQDAINYNKGIARKLETILKIGD